MYFPDALWKCELLTSKCIMRIKRICDPSRYALNAFRDRRSQVSDGGLGRTNRKQERTDECCSPTTNNRSLLFVSEARRCEAMRAVGRAGKRVGKRQLENKNPYRTLDGIASREQRHEIRPAGRPYPVGIPPARSPVRPASLLNTFPITLHSLLLREATLLCIGRLAVEESVEMVVPALVVVLGMVMGTGMGWRWKWWRWRWQWQRRPLPHLSIHSRSCTLPSRQRASERASDP